MYIVLTIVYIVLPLAYIYCANTCINIVLPLMYIVLPPAWNIALPLVYLSCYHLYVHRTTSCIYISCYHFYKNRATTCMYIVLLFVVCISCYHTCIRILVPFVSIYTCIKYPLKNITPVIFIFLFLFFLRAPTTPALTSPWEETLTRQRLWNLQAEQFLPSPSSRTRGTKWLCHLHKNNFQVA